MRFRPWLKRKMEAGEYVAWFAIAADESVAAGAAYPKNLVAVDFSDNLGKL